MENERKSQIIKAAVKRFGRHGLGKTTLDEVARDLRIGKATIYHYFESKEDLFYRSIEWETEQFIEEIKAIFENNEIPLKERFIAYFQCKETISQKYKLLFELFLLLMTDDSFEKEKGILKTMFGKEEVMIEMVLNPVYRKKGEKINPALPGMFVTTSWGWFFGTKLKKTTICEGEIYSKDLLDSLIINLLPDQN